MLHYDEASERCLLNPTLAKAKKMRYNFGATKQYGGYGEEVITAGCGPVIMGSIPISHPTNIRPRKGSDFGL